MTRWSTPAIVLQIEPRKESDLAVSLLTPRHGWLRAVARGGLRSHKRFAGVFEPANEIVAGLMTAPRTGAAMVEHAELGRAHPALRQSPLALARASLLIELVLATVPEQEDAAEAYRLLRAGLARTALEPDSDRWPVTYAFRLLAAAGYRPLLSECARCGREAAGSELGFSAAEGGVVCPRCAGSGELEPRGEGGRVRLSLDCARTLAALMSFPEERLGVVAFTAKSLREARRLLLPFATWRLGRPLNSLLFLERMLGAAEAAPLTAPRA